MVTKVLSKCLFNLCLVPNGGTGILSPWSSIQSSLTKGHNFLTRGKQEKLLLPACQGSAKLAIYVLSQNDANFFLKAGFLKEIVSGSSGFLIERHSPKIF